ncbi:MAG: hypothetical protein EOP14_03130 [Pseudomonas sp.]|nr:MAG: hypothetical protein EOP14_03130 [Pseudomonas sp.]
MQEYSSSTEFINLNDQELQRLIALWRNQVLCGNHEAQGILYAFEAEMMKRRISSSFSVNNSAFN